MCPLRQKVLFQTLSWIGLTNGAHLWSENQTGRKELGRRENWCLIGASKLAPSGNFGRFLALLTVPYEGSVRGKGLRGQDLNLLPSGYEPD
jgi:hypothetical protein